METGSRGQRDLQAYLRWRNLNARQPDVLAAQGRERASIRSEKGHLRERATAGAAPKPNTKAV